MVPAHRRQKQIGLYESEASLVYTGNWISRDTERNPASHTHAHRHTNIHIHTDT